MPASFRTLPLVAVLAAAGLAAGLRAQETPPVPPVPVPSEEMFALAFKHKTGQLQKFKGTFKVDAAISPEGGGPGIGPLPLATNTVLTFTEKVTGTRQGTATVSMGLVSLLSTSEAFGNKVVNRYQNGKATTSVNGKPVTSGSAAATAADLARLKKPAGFRRTPNGLTTPVGGTDNAFGESIGSASFTIVQLPEMPVKVGDTWETTQKVRPKLVGERSPLVIPEIEFRYVHTLKRIDVKGGKKQALIETSGSGATLGEGADNSLNQSVTGVTRFDIDRGAVASSQYNIILGMRLGVPAGAVGGANAPTSVRVDGTVDVVVTELPVPAKK